MTTLVCLPHAGGGPSAFRGWRRWLPANVQIHAVGLPGRERALSQAPLETISEMATFTYALCEQRPLNGERLILCGRSMGALVAFETARRLQMHGRPVAGLCVCSHPAPHLMRNEPTLSTLPRPDLLDELRRLGDTPQEILDDPGLIDLVLPTLRADLAACEAYRYDAGPPLDCPVFVCAGENDGAIPRDGLRPWATHTRGPFDFFVVPGGHLPPTSAGSPFSRAVAAWCRALAEEAKA